MPPSACPLRNFALCSDEDRVFLVAGEPVAAVLCGGHSAPLLHRRANRVQNSVVRTSSARGLGAHLLRAFEAWAKAKGARRLIVAGRQERTLALLNRLGYAPLETVTSKDLPWQKQPFPSS